MPQPLAGPGLGLPLPQKLYPSELTNAPLDTPTNKIGLAPGDELPVPAGTWYIDTGSYCVLEYLDPVTNTWTRLPTCAYGAGPQYIKSDGFTIRVANRTGCLSSTSITAQGSNYVQSTTSIAVTGISGASVTPIIGGALGASIVSYGAGYGVPPIVFIPAPPAAAANSNGIGGIPATGYCTIASGTVSGFTFTNPGAGYNGTVYGVVVPNPTDPNISTGITAASIAFTLNGAGKLTGAFINNPGVAITPGNATLTVSGAGTGATIVPNVMQTVTAASVVGTLTGAVGTVSALLTTVGGGASLGTITNGPHYLGLAFRPRPAQIGLTVVGAATGTIGPQVGTIYDGGLFLDTPTPVIATNLFMASNAATLTNSGTLTLTMGSRPDFVTFQPAP